MLSSEPYMIPRVEHPIDVVVRAAEGQRWSYARQAEEEIDIELTGALADCCMQFYWSEEAETLNLTCIFNFNVPKRKRRAVYELLSIINAALWIGHSTECCGYVHEERHNRRAVKCE